MVTATREGNLGVNLRARSHHILSGTSIRNGGDDEGFNPHELVEAALAACTTVTVQMYANRKDWPLAAVDVQVSIDREDTEAHITRRLELTGELSAEQRERLLAIANKCPIHKLLTGKIEIETRLTARTSSKGSRHDAAEAAYPAL